MAGKCGLRGADEVHPRACSGCTGASLTQELRSEGLPVFVVWWLKKANSLFLIRRKDGDWQAARCQLLDGESDLSPAASFSGDQLWAPRVSYLSVFSIVFLLCSLVPSLSLSMTKCTAHRQAPANHLSAGVQSVRSPCAETKQAILTIAPASSCPFPVFFFFFFLGKEVTGTGRQHRPSGNQHHILFR